MYHNPQIDPIILKGTHNAACLVIHGFTGTPDSMRSVANELNIKGFHIEAPLLAGHGTTPEHLSKTSWKDWYHTVQLSFNKLKTEFDKVFVCGLSLGSLLSLKLAIDYKESIAGIAALATPLHFKPWVNTLLPILHYSPLKLIWKYQKKFDVDIKDPDAKNNFWNYDLMPLSCVKSIYDLQNMIVPRLSEIQAPIILLHSRHDSTAPYDSMGYVAQNVSSHITETVTLENCYHVITLDYEKQIVANKVTTFFNTFL